MLLGNRHYTRASRAKYSWKSLGHLVDFHKELTHAPFDVLLGGARKSS